MVQKRDEGIICKNLNRVLLNDVTYIRFANAYSVFEAGGCYEQMRCKVKLIPGTTKIKRLFKYVNATSKLPSFLPIMDEYWSSREKLFRSTSAMFRFSKKLKALKPLISDIGRQQLGDLSKRAREAHQVLFEKEKKTLTTSSQDDM